MSTEAPVIIWLAVVEGFDYGQATSAHTTKDAAMRGLVSQINRAEWESFAKSVKDSENVDAPDIDTADPAAVLEFFYGVEEADEESPDGGRLWGQGMEVTCRVWPTPLLP